MKNYRYANRGMNLEQIIRYSNLRYRDSGLAIVVKQPTEFLPIRNGRGQIVSCKVESKASVDFIGRMGNVPVAIEAKETQSNNIRFDRVEDHQAEFLDDFTDQGEGEGLVVVSFSLERFYAIPWPFWSAARQAWIDKPKSKVNVCHKGQEWTTPGKASVRMDELLPEWEIPFGGMIGLDYLEGLKLKHR